MSVKEEILKFEKCEAKDLNPKTLFEWVDFFQKNKPQINGLVAGIMLIIFGGQNVGWGIFNNHLRVQPWSGGYEDDGAIFWTIISWFIANIFGLILGSFLVCRYTKMKIYILASILSSISATFFVVYPTNISIIQLARIIASISNGIVYLVILIHASELSIPRIRGYHISVINMCNIVGVLLTSSNLSHVYKTRTYENDPTKMLGYTGLICFLTGLILALFLNRESPVFLIQKYKEKEALNNLMRLRSESHETLSIRDEFNELIQMVKEDSQSSMNITHYCYQFIIVISLKSLFVFSFNMPLNIYFLNLAKINFYDGEVDNTGLYLLSARLTAMIISMILIDFKRIKLFLFSSVGCGIILIFLSQFTVKDDSIYSAIISIIFQIFAGFGISFVSDIYSVDSVNTKIKPIFIALTTSYEILLQIILIVAYFYFTMSISNLLLIFGLVMIFPLLAYPFNSKYKILPDTSGLSLRRARNKFL
ncbi:unnamed protein product [Chironomus riparius]|uniref:Sugar transporter n=1 Tax=Chironomus riparius TaxID=315576 RepID=A0A9N9SAA3_9DIPT|nr:unnamed protein product [Chironomus riparius]